MSGGHCTHPTGGPAIRLKHKKPRVVDFFFFLITPLNCFGCFKTLALFCQGSVKIKLSLLSVHCYTTFMLSSK